MLRINSCYALTHWWLLAHICVAELGHKWIRWGLSPDRCRAIIWINAEILSIGPWWTNFNDILINVHLFSFKKMRAKCRLQCIGHFVTTLTHWGPDKMDHFADDIFKCILLNENVWITIDNSLKFVPKVPINNIPALVQILAWRRPGDKPLSEPLLVSLPTHIFVTRPQWVNTLIQVARLYRGP